MEFYQQRVVVEKQGLDEKIDRLIAFMGARAFSGLTEAEQDRLRRQLGAMSEYSAILGERISCFPAEG